MAVCQAFLQHTQKTTRWKIILAVSGNCLPCGNTARLFVCKPRHSNHNGDEEILQEEEKNTFVRRRTLIARHLPGPIFQLQLIGPSERRRKKESLSSGAFPTACLLAARTREREGGALYFTTL
jgi:hypothetical protein